MISTHPPRGRAGRIERGPPAALVVARELKVVALTRHAALDVADAAPGVQPRAEGPEHGQVGFDAGRFQRDEEQASEAVSHGLRARGPARAIRSPDLRGLVATA